MKSDRDRDRDRDRERERERERGEVTERREAVNINDRPDCGC